MNAFLELARQGKNDWWRFILAVSLILFMWQILGALPSVCLFIFVFTKGNPQTKITPSGQIMGEEQVYSFIAAMLASLIFIVGIFLAIGIIHQRPLRTLITPACNYSWQRFLLGFVVWFILSGLLSLVEALFYPERYLMTSNMHLAIPFAFFALILVPIQTSAEELFFRSYILQGFGLRIRNIWILSIISGTFFMFPHLLNPEARQNYGLMGFYYFFFGAVMAYVTLREGRLEMALGMHAANNLFSILIVNYTISVMPSPSIFTIIELDPFYSVSAAVIGLILFVWGIFGIIPKISVSKR